MAKTLESVLVAVARGLAGLVHFFRPPDRPTGLAARYDHTEPAASTSVSVSGSPSVPTNVYTVTFDPPADPSKVASRELSYRSGTDPAVVTSLAVGDPAPPLRVAFGADYEVILTDVSPAGVRSDPATKTGTANEGGGGGGPDQTKPATPTGLAVTFDHQEP